ncbi:Alpha/Beta hydrolase protein [Mycena olivaceomarginata]|nr:Alpha/Beta hydrolase protein [Mycena olivaceomarginata]
MCVISVSTPLLPATSRDTDFDVEPFRVNLAHEVPHMKTLIQNTRLPGTTLYPVVEIEFAIRLDFLRDLQMKWFNDFDWTKQEAALNKVPHFTAKIEGLTVHFVHTKSKEPYRIPLLMMHGWPGSFQEFLPVIKPLTELWKSPAGKRISFDVIVPSLPGFLFSSPPPQNWTTNDTARIFNTLMVNVLGYSTYALRTEYSRGSVIGYTLYSIFNTSVRAANLKSIPFVAPTPDDIAANNTTLSDIAKVTKQRTADNRATGQGYFTEQMFEPTGNIIGPALYDNPIGQLAWIGGNIQLFPTDCAPGSDPHAGTPPSVLIHKSLLTMVSLYYLTQTFQSFVWLYTQNPNTFSPNYVKPATEGPLVFSLLEFDTMLWPREYVERASNLVLYKQHEFGGHFAGLDNPPALVEDLHDLGVYFEP